MNIRAIVLPVAAMAATLAICGCQGAAVQRTTEPPAACANLTLELTGSGLGKPTVFTFGQLAHMPMTRLDNVLWQKTHEPDEVTSWRGPALQALLAAAEVKPGPMAFTLEAADGYQKRCTDADVSSAIVALQDGDGRWLSEVSRRSGLRLVPPKLTGNYWIRNISRITVELAEKSEEPGR